MWPEPHTKISTIGGTYRLGRKLGCGSFGHVYLAVNMETGEELAAKIESSGGKSQMLIYEAKILRRLQGAPGFATLHYWNAEGDYNVMVMDMLGPSLKDLFYMCCQKFSMKTVLLLADQMLYRIQYLHSKGVIHRDIKPENFLIGRGRQANIIYLIDFGLSKRYRSSKSQQHIPYTDNKSLTGTARYASINAHLGIEQSRRDDIEAIGYVLLYFLRGQLPWQHMPQEVHTKEEKYRKIMETKRATPIEKLCEGQPEVFASYLRNCHALRFEDRPDYGYLRRILKDHFLREGFVNDSMLDWMRPATSPWRLQSAGGAECQRDEQAAAAATTTQVPESTHHPVESACHGPVGSPRTHSRGRGATSRAASEHGAGTSSLHQRFISLLSQSTAAAATADHRSIASHSFTSNGTGHDKAVGCADYAEKASHASQGTGRLLPKSPRKGGAGGFLVSLLRCGTKCHEPAV